MFINTSDYFVRYINQMNWISNTKRSLMKETKSTALTWVFLRKKKVMKQTVKVTLRMPLMMMVYHFFFVSLPNLYSTDKRNVEKQMLMQKFKFRYFFFVLRFREKCIYLYIYIIFVQYCVYCSDFYKWYIYHTKLPHNLLVNSFVIDLNCMTMHYSLPCTTCISRWYGWHWVTEFSLCCFNLFIPWGIYVVFLFFWHRHENWNWRKGKFKWSSWFKQNWRITISRNLCTGAEFTFWRSYKSEFAYQCFSDFFENNKDQ